MPTKIALGNLIDRASIEPLAKVFQWLVGLRLEEMRSPYVLGPPVISAEDDGGPMLVVKLPFFLESMRVKG